MVYTPVYVISSPIFKLYNDVICIKDYVNHFKIHPLLIEFVSILEQKLFRAKSM
jgi:hypothetical protein